ncbi:MAG: YceI family protein [Hyphomonadaceae bacterium]
MRLSALVFASVLAACASMPTAVSTPAAAQEPPTAQAAPTYPVAVNLPAGEYRLDPRHASVIFRIQHQGLAWFTARFDAKAATLTLDPNDPSHSQLSASVDATSVNTGVLNAQGERAFDQTIGRALGSQTTQNITFVSTSIERTGEHTGRITGDLTMNGQTHPATLDATFVGDTNDLLRGGSRVLGFSAQGTIDRTEWGVNTWRAFTGAEVQIVIEAEFVRT